MIQGVEKDLVSRNDYLCTGKQGLPCGRTPSVNVVAANYQPYRDGWDLELYSIELLCAEQNCRSQEPNYLMRIRTWLTGEN